MMWNLYVRVFIKSHLLHCKIFRQFRNQWIHFAVNGLKMRGYRCQTVNHNWPVYFFRLDIPKKRKRKPKPLSICGLTKQKTELHPTRLYQRSHIMSIIRPSSRQPFGLSIWGNGGPAAVVYKLPLIPCLVHSRPVVHASYRRSGLRLGHTRWTAAESDIRFFFFFPRRLLRDLLQHSVLRGTSFFWRGLDVRPPFKSVLIVPRELVSQPGFGRWQRGMCSNHVSTHTRCGRECVPQLPARSLIRPGPADGEECRQTLRRSETDGETVTERVEGEEWEIDGR